MDFMFFITPILSMLIFGLAFGVIITSFVRGARQERKNNRAPRLTVDAKVVAKRADLRRRNTTGDHHYSPTATTYYVTFQVESGDRMELQLQGNQYGLLVEGDQGKLTFQGTRYLDFERK